MAKKQEKKDAIEIEKNVEHHKKISTVTECKDRLCPIHGDRKLKLRGRAFEGTVIRKHKGRVTIQFERVLKVPKFERYEKRKTKIHARLTDCMEKEVEIGDLISIEETRPISKTIHFIVSRVVRKREEKNER